MQCDEVSFILHQLSGSLACTSVLMLSPDVFYQSVSSDDNLLNFDAFPLDRSSGKWKSGRAGIT